MVSEMSWTKRVKHPSKIIAQGDAVEALVLDVDSKNKRISLGMKQIEVTGEVWAMDMSAHRQWNEWTNLELDGAQLLCKKLGIKLPTQRDISRAGVINIKLPSGASLHMFRHGPHFWYYVLSGVAITIDKPTMHNTDVIPYMSHNLSRL